MDREWIKIRVKRRLMGNRFFFPQQQRLTKWPETGAPECRNAGAVRRNWAAKIYMEKRKNTKLDSPKDFVGFVAELQIEPA